MSISELAPQQSPAPVLDVASKTREPAAQNLWACVGLVLVIAAHLPLIIKYLIGLWSYEHYQFYPVVLAAAGFLAYGHCRQLGVLQPGNRWVGGGLLAIDVALLTAGMVLDSPWLGAIAALVMLAALAWTIGGRQLGRALASPWLLLWLVIRLPVHLDDLLVRTLQSTTVAWASRTLDWLQVVHTLSGNVIELPGRRLMVEEACSGVHSLFSSLACTAILVVWMRRRLVPSVLLLLLTPCWVLLANIVRVVAVAVLRDRWQIAADTGWRHEALGLGVFAVVMLLVLSSDRLLLFFTPARWQRATLGPTRWPSLKASTPSPRWLVPLFGTLLALQVPLVIGDVMAVAESVSPTDIPAFGAEALPETFAEWRRTGFDVVDRGRNSSYGQFSQSWAYRSSTNVANASFDYPFIHWHELAVCYESQGWHVENRSVVDAEALVALDLRHPADGRHGYLVFKILDPAGHSIPVPGQSSPERLEQRIEFALRRWRGRLTGIERPAIPNTYQVQLFVESYVPLTDEQREQARRFFTKAANDVVEAWLDPQAAAKEPRS